jgi:cobalt-zinc-cadmium efflux system membrane fusion protein
MELLKPMFFIAFSMCCFLWGCGNSKTDDHAGHDHSKHESQRGDHDDHSIKEHEGHNCDSHGDEKTGQTLHGDHEGELEITLTDEAIKLANIMVGKVIQAKVCNTIELPGEIGFNEDRLAHITPRYGGIAREVKKQLGEYVEEGDVLAVIESNESLTSYSVKAPIAGHIIKKHITPGEYISEEDNMYVMANLATVWVNCEVYPKNAEFIRRGQKVTIKAVGGDNQAEGMISYISPVYNEATRSSIARAVISSQNRKWRPGTFIHASFAITSPKEVPVVSKRAVQVLDEKNIVFVPEGKNIFKPVEVVLGMSDEKSVEIVDGLQLGDKYVMNGAFELKAKIVTSALGDHAGHGH